MLNLKSFFLVNLLIMLSSYLLIAQTTVDGQILDETTQSGIIGATVKVADKAEGVVTDMEGMFKLITSEETPFFLEVSALGYGKKRIKITESTSDLKLTLATEDIELEGVQLVYTPSRVEQTWFEAPVSIEQIGYRQIQQASSFDFYDEINKLRGVHSNVASLTFNTINTRGFATGNNTRFVQLIDGMDNSAPILNFPTGNVVGASELDIESIELVPGASSALYGPNAFNGMLAMRTKNPFDYEGVSATGKFGVTNSDAGGSNNLGSVGIRYGKNFNDKFAFKVNFSYFRGTDWTANDYHTDRNLLARSVDDPGINPTLDPANKFGLRPNFDGLNTYGDEFQIPLFLGDTSISNPVTCAICEELKDILPPGFCKPVVMTIIDSLAKEVDPVVFSRTGFKEEDLLKDQKVESIKADASLHYRITKDLEASYGYRFGRGSTVYQGSERFVFRDFTQQYHRLALDGKNFNILAYLNQTNDGDSYNLTALGALANEYLSPTEQEWAPNYIGNYTGILMEKLLPLVSSGVPVNEAIAMLNEADYSFAHQGARAIADAKLTNASPEELEALFEDIRNRNFNENGAGFVDDSRMYHAEFNYDFTPHLNGVVNLQVGANWRQYDLFTDGTILNEPNGERIKINEGGGYVQVSKGFFDNQLELIASGRFDKNENFEGQFSPRVAAVIKPGGNDKHAIRASYQTAFRSPATQEQYLYFPSTVINVGGVAANASQFGIYNGGSWTLSSYQAYQGCLLAGNSPDDCQALLQTANIEYLQPEKLTALELGYRSKLVDERLVVDLSGYYNMYKDFIIEALVVNKEATSFQGNAIPEGRVWSAFTNADEDINSYGASVGLDYRLRRGLHLTGNYAYADFDLDNPDFQAKFNTPNHRYNVGVNGRKVWEGLGFGLSYRWQDEFFYESAFAQGIVPAFGTIDAQLSWEFQSLGTILKLGGTNLLGDDYRTNIGNPFIGQTYYVSFIFDQRLLK